ncbi:MAG: hypothetical protein U0230_13125 [Polyangiales bacterium]
MARREQTGEGRSRHGLLSALVPAAVLVASGLAFAQGVVVEPPHGGGGSDSTSRRPSVSIDTGTPHVTAFPTRSAPTFGASTETQALMRLSKAACLRELTSRGVAFTAATGPDPAAAYVVVNGPLAGVTLVSSERDPARHAADCRLVLALRAWAQVLHRDGIAKLRYTAVTRPASASDAARGEGGHVNALAIDVTAFEKTGGFEWHVDRHWGSATRGAPPCAPALLVRREPSPVRRIVCAAAEEGRFHVVVTPHFDDAHRDHVHFELVPGSDSVTVR